MRAQFKQTFKDNGNDTEISVMYNNNLVNQQMKRGVSYTSWKVKEDEDLMIWL